MTAIIDDTLVAAFDFLKFFFFFKYLLCYDISIKQKRFALFTLVYLGAIILMRGTLRLGYYTPAMRLPAICILLFSHGIPCRPKTLFLALLTDILIGQFDGFIGSILQLAPTLSGQATYIGILTTLIALPLFYGLCRLCASKGIRIERREQTLFIATQTFFLFLDSTITSVAGNILKASDDPFYSGVLHFAISALALILDIAGLELFFLIQAVRRYQETQRLQEQLLWSQNTYVDQILRQDRLLREFRHDVRGHLTCLDHFLSKGQTEEAKAYMRQIDGCLDASARVEYFTKNPVADALLNGRSSELKARHIQLTVTGELPKTLRIEDFDLCMLLYNLISNAQEACLRLPEKRDRWITLEFDAQPACLHIRMRNPIQNKNLRLQTTKPDAENHGIGLSHIRQCVEKYHGDLEITQENNIFQTEIFFFTTARSSAH